MLSVVLSLGITSCKEDIDDSNLYTFTGQMITDYLQADSTQFSDYLQLLGQVKPSKKSASTMRQLLSARGNYTCFAPTNDAIRFYLDSLYQIGELESTVLSQVPDSVAEPIVFNSIIDCQNSIAYASTDFIEGALSRTNMNDRYVSITFGNDSAGTTLIYVNTNSRVLEKDIEVENGYIHSINKVLSPSTATVADLIESTPNLTFFGHLLDITGWDKKINHYKDEEFDERDIAGRVGPSDLISKGSGWPGYYTEHRYIGYTVFTETDSVFMEKLGIKSIDELEPALNQYLKENAYYNWDKAAGAASNYEDPENPINQFVAYHILPERLIWNKLVIYSNEKGFSNGSPNDGSSFQVNVWEYYETMDPHRRSLKITGIRNGKRINRHATYNLSTYKEKDGTVDLPGVNIHSNNNKYDNNAMNGYYYPIDDILLWSKDVPMKVLNERMRYDICALLPELMTNNCRRTGDSEHLAWYFPADYFDSHNGGSGSMINVSKETKLAYLTNMQNEGSTSTWTNFQCDEWNIQGTYDFVMKLPPVPYTGTYEIRYGVNANDNRGMAQIYIGTNPNNLPAVGIPIDLRVRGDNPAIGWKSDSDLGTTDAIEAKDKAMRNVDYMKGPKYFYPASGNSGRDCSCCTRRIIFRGQLDEGVTYYIRFKSVLQSTSTQFFYDYLEFVPKIIYNGDEPEDKW